MICCRYVTEGGDQDDLLPRLSCTELKTPERGELRDGWEHRSYLGGSVLGVKSRFWNGSGVTEAFGFLDTCHRPVSIKFLTITLSNEF